MAWRIGEHIVSGEIDNRIRGWVSGRLQIAGITEPLTLNLKGDCHPDLAGCLLTFENPDPQPLTTPAPALRQNGIAGDITAARKVRIWDVPAAEAFAMRKRGETPPEHLANGLYVEWLSKGNGRFLIESTDYQLKISDPVWRFTAEEMAKLQLNKGDDAFITSVEIDEDVDEWGEFRCEQFLRENDARTEKYGRLLKEFADHADCERIIAREMGWTWIEDALDAQESGSTDEAEPFADEIPPELVEEEAPDPLREGIDWVRDGKDSICHPIGKRAHDALNLVLDELKAAGHFPDCPNDALGDFVGHFMNLSVKLRAQLQPIAHPDRHLNPPMLVARLKRYLVILNQTLAASTAIEEYGFFPPENLNHHRAELLGIREDMLALITQLREG